MAIKKEKLNYMSAVEHVKSKETIPISSLGLEELDRVIREKTKQNEETRKASKVFEDYPCI